MTTNKTQELDGILEHLLIDYDFDVKDKDSRTFDRAKQAILDWHNKQTLELLDRLELSMRGKTIVDTAEGWQEFIRKHVNGAIEAERKKLKESSDE